MQNFVSKSFQDIFSPSVLAFVLKVGFGSIFLWVTVLWLTWDIYSNFIELYIQKIPLVGSWEWVQSGGSVFIALVVGYMLIIMTISAFTSLFSEPLLKKLAKVHYPEVEADGVPSIGKSIFLTIKATLLFFIMFLVSFPLLFIPVLGQIWMLWLWGLLIKEPTSYDVGSLFPSQNGVDVKSKSMGITAMLASLFNYVPLLNIFAPIFAQILFLHQILGKNK
ncbi:MAG: EI24 domain-containing protein [Campylobacterota bacterium]|nr:EI24 domain-containing protein [Campylobacterota bacterium]